MTVQEALEQARKLREQRGRVSWFDLFHALADLSDAVEEREPHVIDTRRLVVLAEKGAPSYITYFAAAAHHKWQAAGARTVAVGNTAAEALANAEREEGS